MAGPHVKSQQPKRGQLRGIYGLFQMVVPCSVTCATLHLGPVQAALLHGHCLCVNLPCLSAENGQQAEQGPLELS